MFVRCVVVRVIAPRRNVFFSRMFVVEQIKIRMFIVILIKE